MTTTIRDHDRYVAKVNTLVAAGREDIIDEIVNDYRRTEQSGREAFWQPTCGRWPTGRRHRR